MNYCFHGWSKADPLQGDSTPIEHIPIGPLFIDSSLLFSTGVVGVVVVEVVPLFGDTVLLGVELFKAL